MKRHFFIAFFLVSIDMFAQDIVADDSIRFTVNEQNTISIKAIFNNKDTLNLNFDTGTTELILTKNVLNNKLTSLPQLYSAFYDLKIGKKAYKTKVYDAELTGHETDGRFGWDFFKGKVVELNYDKNIMIVHSILPSSIASDPKFTKLKIKYYKDTFLIESEIKQANITNKEFFLFDTGYQRTVMLNSDLLKKNNFPAKSMKVIKKIIMHGAQGNEIPVITSRLSVLKIGKYILKNVLVQITNANKPFKTRDVHNLGNEILRKFNIVLDFQNNFVYLKSNRLFSAKYIDEKKSA